MSKIVDLFKFQSSYSKLKLVGNAVLALVAIYLLYIIFIGIVSSPRSELYVPPQLDANATDHERAVVMANALTQSLELELDTIPGWLPNDLMFIPKIIDNSTEYQRGIIYATRPASDILAKTLARFGKNDTIDSRLADATSRYFTYGENVWGFWFIYDAEGKYKNGIKNWKSWAESVDSGAKNSSVYNVKSDDVYAILKYCSSMLDYVLGRLNNENLGHFQSDNEVYFAKGVTAVVTNVLRGLIAVDASVVERGGQENVDDALKRLNYVAEFNPIYVVAGGNAIGDAMLPNHVAALSRHLDIANNRINDIMQSMEK